MKHAVTLTFIAKDLHPRKSEGRVLQVPRIQETHQRVSKASSMSKPIGSREGGSAGDDAMVQIMAHYLLDPSS